MAFVSKGFLGEPTSFTQLSDSVSESFEDVVARTHAQKANSGVDYQSTYYESQLPMKRASAGVVQLQEKKRANATCRHASNPPANENPGLLMGGHL